MLQRLLGRFAWALIVGAVVNGVIGLFLVALHAGDVISAAWALLLAPIWVPWVIAGVLLALMLLEISLNACRALIEAAFRAPSVSLLERHP